MKLRMLWVLFPICTIITPRIVVLALILAVIGVVLDRTEDLILISGNISLAGCQNEVVAVSMDDFSTILYTTV
jgi:hypothetical protein